MRIQRGERHAVEPRQVSAEAKKNDQEQPLGVHPIHLYCSPEESAEVGVPALAGILLIEPPKGGTPAGHFKPRAV
jgi:hypothetical protein